MIKIIFKLVKRIVLAISLLYILNLVVGNYGIVIPINYLSVGFITLLGIPGLITLGVLFILL